MKSDVNGCSTCPIGQEHYEKFSARVGRKVISHYQYDYRHTDGQLFSTVADTLEKARKKRDEWLSKKLSNQNS